MTPTILALFAKAIYWGGLFGLLYTLGKIVGRRECDS